MKIDSFKIDHTQLLRGIYVSKKHVVNGKTITTFDIRMKAPYLDTPLEAATIHTIEHLGATLLRNDGAWGHRIIYFGPMGCQTGFYLIVEGDYEPNQLLPLLSRVFSGIENWNEEIPGSTMEECGNYKLHDLNVANRESKIFLEQIINDFYPANANYPKRRV